MGHIKVLHHLQDVVYEIISVIFLSKMQNLDHQEQDETKLRDIL